MTSTTSSPGIAVRDSIAGQLHARLHALGPRAGRHTPEALRTFAELRRGVGHRFGDVPGADAALLGLIHFPPDEDGSPPRMTPQLGRLLDDALMVASLAAFGRPAVALITTGTTRSGRRSFGTDCRPLRATRPTAAEALFRSILGAERETGRLRARARGSGEGPTCLVNRSRRTPPMHAGGPFAPTVGRQGSSLPELRQPGTIHEGSP